MKWKEALPPMQHWDIEITRRSNRLTVITVRLYQDLVEEIILKAYRAQEGVWPCRQVHPHPLSQRYLCSLHYRTLDRRLWSEEYLAFVTLGEQYQIVTGRGQGTSRKAGRGSAILLSEAGAIPLGRLRLVTSCRINHLVEVAGSGKSWQKWQKIEKVTYRSNQNVYLGSNRVWSTV